MGRKKKPTDPCRYLGDFHDFIRVLYHLRKGLTKYAFAKLMSVDNGVAACRLDGWVQLGVVEKREDGKYYLKARKITIPGFGVIEVLDNSINLYIDASSKFLEKVRANRVEVYIE